MIFLWMILSAFAEEPISEASNNSGPLQLVKMKKPLTSQGNLRLNATSYPGFLVDFERRDLESRFIVDSRFRTQANYKKNGWNFELGGDILHGQLAGAGWNLDGSAHRYHPERVFFSDVNGYMSSWQDHFLLRSAQVKKKMGPAILQSGVTTSHWGLGLVSNDGNHEQTFSRTDYGDRVFRTSVALMPSEKFVLMTGGDFVLEDDIGGYTDGHRSLQGLLSAQLFSDDKKSALGLLGVYRHQTRIEDERILEGFFIDGYAKTIKQLGPMELYAAAEGAYIHGDHGQIANRNNPAGLKVRSYGAVAELEARHRHGVVGLHAGYASGDGDSSDEVYSAFSMDRDYNAGSILFDLHQAATEVATYNLITDPEHSGTPPDGVDFAVTEGAIRQAMFLQPSLTITKLKSVDIAVGSVLAWNTAPIRSPFISAREGGIDVNHLGQETDGYQLGTEVNWAVIIHHEYQSGLKNMLSLEGAHLLASDNIGLEKPISMFRVQSNVGW